jgi:hypothetical protein
MLMSLGQTLPATLRKRKQDEEAAAIQAEEAQRQKEKDALAAQVQQAQLGEITRKADAEKAAATRTTAGNTALADSLASITSGDYRNPDTQIADPELEKEKAITANYGGILGAVKNRPSPLNSANSTAANRNLIDTVGQVGLDQQRGMIQNRSPVEFVRGKVGQYSDVPAVKETLADFEKQAEMKATADAAKAKAEEDRTFRAGESEKDRQARLDAAGLAHEDRSASRDIALSQKTDQRTSDRLSKMSKDLDPSAMVRGAFSISKQVIDRADRLRTLDDYVQAYQNGNADSRQIEELAIGMNSLLSGSNTGAQEQVKMLVPKTAIGNASKMYEFLSGNPQGTNQQAFVKRMMGTIENEKRTAQAQINKTRFSRIAQYKDVEAADPVGFNDVLRSWEIDPDEYHAWKQAGYKQPDVAKAPGSAGAAGGTQPIALSGDKAARLAELRKKQAAGTLGK